MEKKFTILQKIKTIFNDNSYFQKNLVKIITDIKIFYKNL